MTDARGVRAPNAIAWLRPARAVGVVLILLLAIDIGCVVLWGRDIPLAEDWLMVPLITGHEPDKLAWLWAQNNEHRLPLPRLVYWLLLEAVPDFRVGMVFNQLLLGLLAVVLARTAWSVRGGRSSYLDVIFPLSLLHIGHWNNLVWGWQLQFVASVFLAGLLLAEIVARPGLLDGARAARISAYTLLLTLSGANGLLVALPVLVWLGWQAAMHWVGGNPGASRRVGAMLAAAVLASLLITAAYFIGYQRPLASPPPPTATEFARMLLKYLAYSFGPGTRWAWPPATAAAVAACLIVTWALGRAWRRRGTDERYRVGGLLAFGASCAAIALAIAWARGSDLSNVPDRYALLSAMSLPFFCMAMSLYGPGRLRIFVPAAVLAVLLAYLPVNVLAAREWRDWYVGGMRLVERDIAEATPVDELARTHYHFLMHWSEPRVDDGIRMLRDAGIGPFSRAGRDRRPVVPAASAASSAPAPNARP